jgi:hypothetical protein
VRYGFGKESRRGINNYAIFSCIQAYAVRQEICGHIKPIRMCVTHSSEMMANKVMTSDVCVCVCVCVCARARARAPPLLMNYVFFFCLFTDIMLTATLITPFVFLLERGKCKAKRKMLNLARCYRYNGETRADAGRDHGAPGLGVEKVSAVRRYTPR